MLWLIANKEFASGRGRYLFEDVQICQSFRNRALFSRQLRVAGRQGIDRNRHLFELSALIAQQLAKAIEAVGHLRIEQRQEVLARDAEPQAPGRARFRPCGMTPALRPRG